MRIPILLSLLLLVSPVNAGDRPIVIVTGPTIVAFRAMSSSGAREDEQNANEALADFQVYADRASEPLKKAKIDGRPNGRYVHSADAG
jgi:hypothetical protein